MQAYEVKTKDGLALKVTKWNDIDGGGKGTLIIIHGIGEHQGRYSHVVKHFIDLQAQKTNFLEHFDFFLY